MKKLLLFFSIIVTISLTACGKPVEVTSEETVSEAEDSSKNVTSEEGDSSSEEIIEIDTDDSIVIVASPEEIKAAKESGYVIMEDGAATDGKDKWLSFYESVLRGEVAEIRIINIYTLDNLNCTEEYYEAEKDNYPNLFASELVYNGKDFTISPLHYDGSGFSASYIEGYDNPPTTWKYLMHYTGKPNSTTAIFNDYDRYVLVNDDTVSWEDIEYGMYSSQFDDFIPFDEVFCDYTLK